MGIRAGAQFIAPVWEVEGAMNCAPTRKFVKYAVSGYH